MKLHNLITPCNISDFYNFFSFRAHLLGRVIIEKAPKQVSTFPCSRVVKSIHNSLNTVEILFTQKQKEAFISSIISKQPAVDATAVAAAGDGDVVDCVTGAGGSGSVIVGVSFAVSNVFSSNRLK